MTTRLRRHPKAAILHGILQYFHDVGPSYVVSKSTSGLCHRILFRGLGRKLEVGWGELFRRMLTTLFHEHPEHYLHTLVRTRHTLLQKQTLRCGGLGFRDVGEPLPRTAGNRCCAAGFSGVLKLLSSICVLHRICGILIPSIRQPAV